MKEVDRRLFRERLLRAEAEFQEKEAQRMEREREMTRLRRIHEREIYVLKRKLHEATSTIQQQQQQHQLHNNDLEVFCGIAAVIQSFCMVGSGSNAHIEYSVKIVSNDDSWTILRRFRKFRDLVSCNFIFSSDNLSKWCFGN